VLLRGGQFLMSEVPLYTGPMLSGEGATLTGLKTFDRKWLKPRPDFGLDLLTCVKFSQQRYTPCRVCVTSEGGGGM